MTTVTAQSAADESPRDVRSDLILTPSMRSHHRWMLWMAGIVVVAALILDVGADREHVFVRGFPQLIMPGTCPSRELFHHNCPGCGLTRSIIFLVHNEWRASWEMHHVGWLMALAIVGQVPYRILCLRHGRMVLGKLLPKVFGYLLIALLIGNWLVGLLLPGASNA